MNLLINTGVGAIILVCIVIAALIFARALEHRLLKWIFATAVFLLLSWGMGGIVRVAWEIHQRLSHK